MPQKVHVALGARAYDIVVGSGLLATVGQFVKGLGPNGNVLVVTDTNVAEHFATPVTTSLGEAGLRNETLVLPPGEQTKCLAQWSAVLDRMVEAAMDRRSVVVALGGGVVGDLAGFAAATYMRGVPLVQLPTTLLAQVDSSVGGKTAVDHPKGKNLIGAFHQPAGVLIDIATLRTLPPRDFLAGMAEVIKYGVIMDAELFAYLESHVEAIRALRPDVMEFVVARCCRLKADVVEADETEGGLRATLNYGHTFGHAFETVAGYDTYRHGEAVAVGMLCASTLGERLGMTAPDVTARQRRLLEAFDLPTRLAGVAPDAAVEAMLLDKKTLGGRLRPILPHAIGRVEQVDGVERALVAEVLTAGGFLQSAET